MSCTATAFPASSAPTKPILDEPDHVVARARVHERRPRDPDRIPAAVALVHEDLRHQRVVDRLLARDLADHELELAVAPDLFHERGRVDVDPLPPVLRLADGDLISLPHAPPLTHPQHAIRSEHERRIHPWLTRQPPLPPDPHVGRQVGGREEALGKHAVGRGRLEPRIGRGDEGGLGEVGRVEGGHDWKDH
jgi:hypothetical protein